MAVYNDKTTLQYKDGDDTEEDFFPEKIVDRRINPATRTIEYLIKWSGYDDRDNTWELKENFDYPKLIAEFEASRVKSEINIESPNLKARFKNGKTEKDGNNNIKKRKSEMIKSYLSSKKRKDDYDISDLDSNEELEPEEIIGVAQLAGELTFLVKWPSTNKVSLIPAKQAHLKFPLKVIQFYEEHLVWNMIQNEDK